MSQPAPRIAPKQHFEVLDGLRGVAAMMVVVFHICETWNGGNHARQIINHGYMAVDFFFLLSGFVIAYAYDDRWGRMTQWEFYKRRLVRLQKARLSSPCWHQLQELQVRLQTKSRESNSREASAY